LIAITLHFSDCCHGTIDYNFTSAGVSGSVPIVCLANDNVPLCQSLGGTQNSNLPSKTH
jgi:hypothetical protein